VVVADDPADVAVHLGHLRRRSGPTPESLPDVEPRFTAETTQTWTGQIHLAHALGLRVPPTAVLEPGEELTPDAFRSLTAPVVVKPLPSRIAHKTDRGLVMTGLMAYEETSAAAAKVAKATGAAVSVLVQQQVRGIEVLVAATVDPDWGPVLTIGAGGGLVEILDDHFAVSIPCSSPALRARLEPLRLQRLLAGYRGQPEADVDALLHAASRLQTVALNGGFSELELNPVIVETKGSGAFMVDVLAR
jgi:hypothetical protein